MNKIKKILAPTDLSDLSCVGLRYAMETAGERQAEVVVYLAVPIGEDWFPSSEGENPERDYVAREKILLDKFLRDKFADELGRLKITQKVAVGAASRLRRSRRRHAILGASPPSTRRPHSDRPCDRAGGPARAGVLGVRKP